MAHHSHEPQVIVLPPNKEKIKHLWKVALYMGIITALL
jgi:cytochrome c oxidase subunit IV